MWLKSLVPKGIVRLISLTEALTKRARFSARRTSAAHVKREVHDRGGDRFIIRIFGSRKGVLEENHTLPGQAAHSGEDKAARTRHR